MLAMPGVTNTADHVHKNLMYISSRLEPIMLKSLPIIPS